MSQTKIRRIKSGLETGRAIHVTRNANGSVTKRSSDPEAWRRARATAHAAAKSALATRRKLHLSQTRFAKLLGVSLHTLRNWEQGHRAPSGAARVLLRIAATQPDV
jgi:putative transcriptional regulator